MNQLHCECEHIDHTTNGKGHPYGGASKDLEPCRTAFGTFQLCAACRAAGHLSLVDPTVKEAK